MAQKRTPARKAVDRAAKACQQAYERLSDMNDYIPDEVFDRHYRWLKDLSEYAEYLDRCTWPDKV